MHKNFNYHIAYFYIDQDGNVGCGDVTGVELSNYPPDTSDVISLKEELKNLYSYRNVIIINMFLVSNDD